MAAPANTRRRVLIIAGVVVAMLAIGAILAAVGRSGATRNEDTAVSPELAARPVVPSSAASGSDREQAGVPGGFARDEAGAVAAAIAYSAAPQRWLYFTDEEIRAAVAEIATPVAAPRLTEEVVTEVSRARDGLAAASGRVWWLVHPLAFEVTSITANEATVDVWTVTVLSAEEVAAPQTEWLTVTIELAWVDGDWRVDAIRDAPGPTPITGPGDQPWDAGPFDATLAGFTRIDGEPTR